MSQGVIEPTAVHPPATTGRQRFYQTYNTRYVQPPNPPIGGQQAGFNYGGSRTYNLFNRVPGGAGAVTVPKPLPRFLGSRGVILFAWGAAMIMVSLDEWHTHHVLPRPARLWYTSITYFILAALSSFDAVVPLATMLAIGLTIAVAYNYYTGNGGFGQKGAVEGGVQQGNTTGTGQKPGTTTAGGRGSSTQ